MNTSKDPFAALPAFLTAGTADEPYICYGRDIRGFNDVTAAEVDAYCDALGAAGFSVYAQNEIGAARFATYTKGDAQIHVGYFPNAARLKIALCAGDWLPPAEPIPNAGVVKTAITQIGRRGIERVAPGMSFAIALSDGRFVLIDGGSFVEEDCDDLYAFLRERTPAGQKPVIAAWLWTHAHIDHIELPQRFIERYHDAVVVQMLGYNFPDYREVAVENENAAQAQQLVERCCNTVRAYYPSAPHFVFHTGQRLYFPGVTFEFIYTQEDRYPKAFRWINFTSAAFRVVTDKKTALILSDCDKSLCRFMAENYGAALKCDVLQPTHHGFNGGWEELYRCADPDVCFWACDKTRFLNDARCTGLAAGFEFNRVLRDPDLRPRTHYLGGETHTVELD